MIGREVDVDEGPDLFAIAPTLFDVAGAAVDSGAMRETATWMVGRGIPDLLLTGSYGEFQSLTDDERVQVVRAVRGAPGVGSVMACAAHPSTDATARLAERLAAEGADAIMVAAPMASEVTPGEVLRHFEVIASRVPVPLVVYNNPVFGHDLTVAQLERIVADPAYRAVKQGTKSLQVLAFSVAGVHRASAGRARLLAASDLTGAQALFAGADGLTSTNSWAFPEAMVALVAHARREEWQSARRVAAALEPYFALARRIGQPRTVKGAMTLRGLPGGGVVRLPYVALEGSEIEELREELQKCDAALGALGITPCEGGDVR